MNSKGNTKFVALNAAVADYNKGHYIEIPKFTPGMLDLLNRDYYILKRIQTVPATGHPSRYWEQTKLPHMAKFRNPRLQNATDVYGADGQGAMQDLDYGRVEKFLPLKAMTSGITFTLFDKEVVKQQDDPTLVTLLEKDFNDMYVDFYRTQSQAIWTGKGTSVEDTAGVEYCGLLTQITSKVEIANPYSLDSDKGVLVSDAIRTQIAKQVADTTWDAYPTALYANPVTIDYIQASELRRKGVSINLDSTNMEIVPGVSVPTIATQRGHLPIIPDPSIPLDTTTEPGKTIHTIVALNERLVERHYLTDPNPRVFNMGKDKQLLDDYVAVLFDNVVAKGCAAGAHFKVTFKTEG